jgi:hypothetical protein
MLFVRKESMLDKFDVEWVGTLNSEYKKPLEQWTARERIDFVGILCHWKAETSYEKGEVEAAKTFRFIADMITDLSRNRIVESEKYKHFQQMMNTA